MLQDWRRLPFLVIGALLLATAVPAAAQEGYSLDDFTVEVAQDLLDVCTVPDDHVHYWEAQAFCFGYFQGGAAFHRALAAGPEHDPIVCPPAGVTIRDAVTLFVDYARRHPEHLDDAAMDVVFRAASEEWPCRSA
jgi:hypothetical protein